jgi:hypothetical protein
MRNYPLCLNFLGVFLICAALMACSTPQASPALDILPVTPFATPDPLYHSNGGGDPRGAGYWLVWNTCTEGNQSATAKTNGGRAAGWILMDDLLTDPGILVGSLEVKTCDQAAAILQESMPEGEVKNLLPFYHLATELLTTQLNLAVPAESCPAVEQAVQAGQLLLVSAGYQGSRSTLAPKDLMRDSQLAEILAEELERYNIGQLCR